MDLAKEITKLKERINILESIHNVDANVDVVNLKTKSSGLIRNIRNKLWPIKPKPKPKPA
jgi:hypothetical protein